MMNIHRNLLELRFGSHEYSTLNGRRRNGTNKYFQTIYNRYLFKRTLDNLIPLPSPTLSKYSITEMKLETMENRYLMVGNVNGEISLLDLKRIRKGKFQRKRKEKFEVKENDYENQFPITCLKWNKFTSEIDISTGNGEFIEFDVRRWQVKRKMNNLNKSKNTSTIFMNDSNEFLRNTVLLTMSNGGYGIYDRRTGGVVDNVMKNVHNHLIDQSSTENYRRNGISVLKFHKKFINIVTSAGFDGQIKFWDIRFTNHPLDVLGSQYDFVQFDDIDSTAHKWPIISLEFLNDGNHLISMDIYGTVKLWKLSDNTPTTMIRTSNNSDNTSTKLLRTFNSDNISSSTTTTTTSSKICISDISSKNYFSSDREYFPSYEEFPLIINESKRKSNKCFPLMKSIDIIHLSTDNLNNLSEFMNERKFLGEYLLIPSTNGNLNIIDMLSGRCVRELKSHFSPITSLCQLTTNKSFDPLITSFISSSYVDGTNILWKAKDFEDILTYPVQTSQETYLTKQQLRIDSISQQICRDELIERNWEKSNYRIQSESHKYETSFQNSLKSLFPNQQFLSVMEEGKLIGNQKRPSNNIEEILMEIDREKKLYSNKIHLFEDNWSDDNDIDID
ncbi:hypothetical protein SNEBB_003613 [Seison nebaliae]|nr:hypothetical protein SNEBB_003613 [Seison nebaliae]